MSVGSEGVSIEEGDFRDRRQSCEVAATECGQRRSFNRGNGFSEIEGKAARVAARERGQRTSFKIVCCNFCKGLFLKAAWRWKEYGNGANGMSDMAGKAAR